MTTSNNMTNTIMNTSITLPLLSALPSSTTHTLTKQVLKQCWAESTIRDFLKVIIEQKRKKLREKAVVNDAPSGVEGGNDRNQQQQQQDQKRKHNVTNKDIEVPTNSESISASTSINNHINNTTSSFIDIESRKLLRWRTFTIDNHMHFDNKNAGIVGKTDR